MKNHSFRAVLWTLSGVTLVHVCAVLAAYQFSVSGQDILELRPPVLVAKLVAESRPKVAVTPAPSAVPEPKSEPRSTPKPKVKPEPKPLAKLESKSKPESAFKPNEAEVASPALSQKMPESLPQAQPGPETAILIPPRVEAHGRGNAPPAYPVLSKRLKEEGEVLLQIRILRDGSVSDIRIQRSSGYARLDAAALAAVEQWRYQPAYSNGQPIDYDYLQPIEFKLR